MLGVIFHHGLPNMNQRVLTSVHSILKGGGSILTQQQCLDCYNNNKNNNNYYYYYYYYYSNDTVLPNCMDIG